MDLRESLYSEENVRSQRRRASEKRKWKERRAKEETKAEVCLFAQTMVMLFLFCLIAGMTVAGGLWGSAVKEAASIVLQQNILLERENFSLPPASLWQPQLIREAVYTWVNKYIVPKVEETNTKQQGLLSGQGGWFPVELSGDCTELDVLVPPEGCTLAPVITTAKATAPVTGRITSPFGYRYHPITMEPDFHTGVDIAAPAGTAVHAVLPGTVEKTGFSASYGNYIVVRHSSQFFTGYHHCSKIIAQEGTVLRRGDRIATVGSTGISTGPHLHFEVIVNGQKTDPLWTI